jgi:NDP-sugar pyrophosphorylase family protein
MVKIRVSISIDKNILEKLDREVDGITIKSRSEAIEKIIDKHVSERKKCVILAGGKPRNLYVREAKTYRPLLDIGGETLIENIIRKVKKGGYSDIIIIGAKEVLSEIYKRIGEGKDVVIEYIEEKTHLNSANTLLLAKTKIKDTFLFVPCDHYFEIDLQAMEKYHKHQGGIATLAVYSGTEYMWNKSSIVELKGNLITSYEEKPERNKTFLTALMMGFLEPEVFNLIPTTRLSYSLQEDVFPELAKRNQVYGYLYSGVWKNIHTKEDAAEIKKLGKH